MLWNVKVLVPRCGLWWTRWALYVVLWRNAQRGNWNTTLCATWKLEHYVMHNVKKRKPLTLRREYMNTFCHIVLAKLLTYCLQKRMFHHYAAMFKIYLILIFTSDELPLLIYSVMPVKTNNCHMLLYIGQVFVMSEYSSLSLTTYINITSDIPQWHVLDIFINCFTDRFVTIRVHNKWSRYFCRMSLGNVCAELFYI